MDYSKIYTHGGDKGETSLGNGKRFRKDDPILIIGGMLDAMNCSIGAIHFEDPENSEIISKLQDYMFAIMGDVYSGDKSKNINLPYFNHEEALQWLNNEIDIVVKKLNGKTQTHWIKYGKGGRVAYLYESICTNSIRPCELQIWHLIHNNYLKSEIGEFFNALSKLFYLIGISKAN